MTRWELADMIADHSGRSVIDADLELADQIAEKLGATLDPDEE